MRDTIATDGRARVMAGSTRWESEPAPPTGSQLSHSEKTTISTRPVQKIGIDRPNSDASRATASKTELGQTAETTPAATPTAAAIRSAAVASCSVAGHASASSAATGRFCWIERPRSPRARRPTYSRYRTANGLSRPRCSRSAATASLVACSPSISVTASPGSRSTVSMTTKTTPSSTGTARRRRRSVNVSIRRLPRAPLLVEPGLPEGQVVLDGVDAEALHRGARDDDLLGRVHRDPHHLFREDVLRLSVELLALGLVLAPARLLDERVEPRILVPRRVPPRRRHLLRMEEREERVVGIRARRHPAQREQMVVERVAAELREHRAPLEELRLGLHPDVLEHGLHGLGDLGVLGIAPARRDPGEAEPLPALLHDPVGPRGEAGLPQQGPGAGAIERVHAVELHVLVAEHARRQDTARRPRRAFHDVVEDRLAIDGVEQRLPHADVVQRRKAGVHAD